MNAYFDLPETANCAHISSVVFNEMYSGQLIAAGFSLTYSRKYKLGIYPISLKEYSLNWCGKKQGSYHRHILYALPNHVIRAARQRKLIIVMDNQSEGFPLVYKGCDGFKETHAAMAKLALPPNSVILFDSNQKFNEIYHTWCIDNRCTPIIQHVWAFTHTFYFDNTPTHPLINIAINNKEVKDFSSLNRTMRQHRIDHLAQIIVDGIISKGLVSGYCSNDPDNPERRLPKQIYTNFSNALYSDVLNNHLPLTIDGSFERMEEIPDTDSTTIFNHWIYKNSLLSFVTETAFHYPGAFITEKTMKPIAAGHPFIILGQYRILDTLWNMGYITEFKGIDQSYDNIEDPFERFSAVHRSLKNWVDLDRSVQLEYIAESMPMIEHNRKLFNRTDFMLESYSRLFAKCKAIFKEIYA
jgi:hypothetical protein